MKNPTLAVIGLCIAFAVASATASDLYHNFTGSGTNIVYQTMTPNKGAPPTMGTKTVLTSTQRTALRSLWEVGSLDLPGDPVFTCIRFVGTNGVANLNFRLSAKEARFIFTPTPQEKAAAQAALASLQ